MDLFETIWDTEPPKTAYLICKIILIGNVNLPIE